MSFPVTLLGNLDKAHLTESAMRWSRRTAESSYRDPHLSDILGGDRRASEFSGRSAAGNRGFSGSPTT